MIPQQGQNRHVCSFCSLSFYTSIFCHLPEGFHEDKCSLLTFSTVVICYIRRQMQLDEVLMRTIIMLQVAILFMWYLYSLQTLVVITFSNV